MKIVVAHPGANFSVQDVYTGWVEALRELGQHVVEFNFADRLTFYGSIALPVDKDIDENPTKFKKALSPEDGIQLAINGLYATLFKTRPDVLIAISAFFLEPELFDLARAYSIKVVILHTESPYEDSRQLKLASHADLNLLNDPINIEQFDKVAPTMYLPHAYRPTIHKPGESDATLAADLVFIGSGYPSRIEFFEAMDLTGIDFFLGGNWRTLDSDSGLKKYVAHDIKQCLDNEDAVRVYRSSKCGINLYRHEAENSSLSIGWAMSPREIEMAATGIFFLREPRGEGDYVLDMLPTFESPGDASEKLHWYLAHDDERNKLAIEARAAIADRTFVNHATALMRLLEKKG